MKTIAKTLILSLLISLIWLLMSCGARKVSKQSSKEEIKTEVIDNSVIEKQSESNVKQTSTIKVDDKNETITEETITEPADNTKESFVIEKDGTKVILNNAKKTVRKTTKKNNTATVKESLTVEAKKEAVKEQKNVTQANTYKKENSSREVKKEQFNPLKLLWVIGIGLIIYGAYRIYKKLPLFPKF